MLPSKRYRNIIVLMVLQALLFVLYSARLHFHNDNRTSDDASSNQLLDNRTARANATEISSRTSHDAIVNGHASISMTDMTDVISSVQSVNSSWQWVVNSTGNGGSPTASNATVIVVGNTKSKPSLSEKLNIFRMNMGHSNSVGAFLSFPGPNDMSSDCIESFLKTYSKHCDAAIIPVPLQTDNASALCPCIPQTIIGISKVSLDETTFPQTEVDHPELLPGGHWSPTSCVARQRIAIIVPFRDRESHLKVFLRILHPFLQRQLVDYTVFVVEQERPAIFNKASLMNAGFKEVRSLYQIDCFIFHDVDMLPEDDRNFYGCYESPRHVGAYVDKYEYNLLYDGIFGGATAFTEKQFLKVNGYSNEFYGWGGEDDDMFNRIKWTHLKFLRFPKCVARYKMIKHKRDKSNPYVESLANRAWKMRPQVYKKNGLSSLSYRLVNLEKRPLFTRILIALDDPPVYKNDATRSSISSRNHTTLLP